MKKSIALLTVVFLYFTSIQLWAQEKYEIVPNAGQLTISGSSNTADWELKSQYLTGDAQLVLKEGELKNIARVIIDIDGETIENSLNKRMTKKAQKALQVKEHPVVTFFAYGFAQSSNGPKKIQGTISIAGKTSDILFDFTSRVEDDIVWIVAEADSKFSDFGLEPPTDFGGAITCKNEIKIEVQLPFALPKAQD